MLVFKALKTISTFFFVSKNEVGVVKEDTEHPALTSTCLLEQAAVFLPPLGLRQDPPLPATLSTVKEVVNK